MRLREADVREETIAALLGHTRPGMTAHCSVAQVAEPVEALNRITDERYRTDLSAYSQSYLNKIALRLNQRPRKTLGFETPADKLRAVLR